jgi:hypothetical protein
MKENMGYNFNLHDDPMNSPILVEIDRFLFSLYAVETLNYGRELHESTHDCVSFAS